VKAYYDRRAPEYDDWYEKTGVFAREHGSRWTVFKRYFTPAGLLAELGGDVTIDAGRWFVAVRSPRA
jgi:hypothetical protein